MTKKLLDAFNKTRAAEEGRRNAVTAWRASALTTFRERVRPVTDALDDLIKEDVRDQRGLPLEYQTYQSVDYTILNVSFGGGVNGTRGSYRIIQPPLVDHGYRLNTGFGGNDDFGPIYDWSTLDVAGTQIMEWIAKRSRRDPGSPV